MEISMNQLPLLMATTIAILAAVADLRTRTIPNALVVVGSIAGFGANAWIGGAGGMMRSALGALVGLCVFLPFFLLRGMGGGDVKLMAALGSCLGAVAVIQTALVASIVGAAFAIVAAARQGVLGRTLLNSGRLLGSWVTRGPRPVKELSLDNPKALKIPYALPIAAGAVFIALSAS